MDFVIIWLNFSHSYIFVAAVAAEHTGERKVADNPRNGQQWMIDEYMCARFAKLNGWMNLVRPTKWLFVCLLGLRRARRSIKIDEKQWKVFGIRP